ncbi:MAG: hypothetical protein GWN93_26765 [Deltaproteobacteria bacterium]|nr:hypothetical protein [Deltaproteobacteria bacterium]
MSQTSYPLDQGVAIKGQPADNNDPGNDIVTYNNPDDQIVFGRGVVKKAGDENGAKLPASGSDDFLGVALRNMQLTDEYYPVKSALPVFKRGRIYVEVEEAVTPDDDVYVRYAGKAQVQTLTFDADLVTDNDFDVDVDGVAMTQVPFNSTHDQTMSDIADQLVADFPQIASATTPGGGSRVITITAASTEADVAITDPVVTGGGSQAGAVVAETVASVSEDDKGLFRNDADSSTCFQVTNARFMTAGSGAGSLVVLDLNLV